MATASGTGSWIARGVHVNTWSLTSSVTSGRAFSAPHLPDKTVELSGTFGCTVIIQGSNAPTTGTASWVTLNDSRGEGNALSFTAANAVAIMENPRWIRPLITLATGAAVTAVNVRLLSQSTRR